jgi:hypothetical protein
MAQQPVFWTEERIIAALRRDGKRRGRPPRSTEWKRAARRRRERPVSERVWKVFGSWDAALVAAGLDPEGRGADRPGPRSSGRYRADARRRGRPPTLTKCRAPSSTRRWRNRMSSRRSSSFQN